MKTKLLLLIFCTSSNLLSYGQNLITNGDFSGSGGWTASPDFYFGTTYTNCPCGTPPCTGYAYLSASNGSPGNNLSGVLQQDFTISQNYSSANFIYCWNATSTETTSGNDLLQVRIVKLNPTNTIIVNTHSIVGNVSGSTVNYVLTDPNFLQAGTQIQIQFIGSTNASLATTIRVDDVSLIGTCTPPSPPTGLTIQSTNCNTVDLSWNPVSGSGITYQVFDNQTSCAFSFGSVFGPTSSTSATVTGLSSNTTYYFVVYSSNSCGQSTNMSNCVTTTTLTAPGTATITGSSSGCAGTPITFSASASNATSYSWTAPAGWSPNSGTGTNFTSTPGSSGSVSVIPSNSCGNGTQGSINITINSPPTTPIVTPTGTVFICQGQSATLTLTNPCSGCSIHWTQCPTCALESGNPLITNISGNWYCYQDNSCGTSANSNTVVVNLVSISVSASQDNPATQGNCNGTATVTTSGGALPYSYNWSTSPAQTTSTATGLCGNTSYSVSVTDANNCTASTAITISEVTEINEYYHSPQISIHSNPAIGSFTICIESIVPEKTHIKIYNILGETVYSSTIEKINGKYLKEINLGHNSKGMYFVRLNTGDKTYHSKLILE